MNRASRPASTPIRRALPVIVDVALIAAALTDAVFGLYYATGWETALSIVAAAGLVFRRHLPYVTLALVLPGLFLGSALVAAIIALYSVAAYTRNRVLITISAAITLTGYVVVTEVPADVEELTLTIIYGVLFVAGPIALGLLTATRGELAERLRQLHASQDEERRLAADRALATERANLAREMHDVVSHQISLIAVQAGALQVRAPDRDTRTIARTIREMCVTTLDELRVMVTVLRRAGTHTENLTPQPALRDLPLLLSTSGLAISTDLELPNDLPANLQRTIYRTIQEALTNARKHAPGAPVTIHGHTASRRLILRIHTAPSNAPSSLPSAQLGLTGLRERAELLGGTLSTTHDDTGFTVKAEYPTG